MLLKVTCFWFNALHQLQPLSLYLITVLHQSESVSSCMFGSTPCHNIVVVVVVVLIGHRCDCCHMCGPMRSRGVGHGPLPPTDHHSAHHRHCGHHHCPHHHCQQHRHQRAAASSSYKDKV